MNMSKYKLTKTEKIRVKKEKTKQSQEHRVCYLRGADDPPLVLTPIHTQNFVSVSLQSSSGFHDKLAETLHLLRHLMYCTHIHTCTSTEQTMVSFGDIIDNRDLL